MAFQLASDYIAGMTDDLFEDLAVKTGYMKEEDFIHAERGKTQSSTVQEYVATIRAEQEWNVPNSQEEGKPNPQGQGDAR